VNINQEFRDERESKMKTLIAKLLITSLMLINANLYAYNVYNKTDQIISFDDPYIGPGHRGMQATIHPKVFASCDPTEKDCYNHINYHVIYAGQRFCDPANFFNIPPSSSRGFYLEVSKKMRGDGSFETLIFSWKKDNFDSPIRTNTAYSC
jgi:hypothetical protein